MPIPVSCTGPASPVMGIGALKLLGSSWRLGLNVEAEVVLAMDKAMMPWDHAEMVGCGLQTAKACGTRDLRGVLQMPQLPAAVQTWPGLWCPLLHVSQQGSGRKVPAVCQPGPLEEAGSFLGHPREPGVSLESTGWCRQRRCLHGSVLATGRNNLVPLSEMWPV